MTRIIKVEDYNKNWPILFQNEYEHLTSILGANAIAIHHIGSTSVPGLCAKPIIDILLEVKNLSELESGYAELVILGYQARGENGIVGRRYFQKGGTERSHHLHAFQQGNIYAQQHLVFRNYLRTHADIALQYGELKQVVVKQCQNNAELYMQGKNSFIQHHLALAMRDFASSAENSTIFL